MKKIIIGLILAAVAAVIFFIILGKKNSEGVISQSEADSIWLRVVSFVKMNNEKYGGMSKQATDIKNAMLEPLFKGGYEIQNNKPVRKR
jgi:hypothetical protein